MLISSSNAWAEAWIEISRSANGHVTWRSQLTGKFHHTFESHENYFRGSSTQNLPVRSATTGAVSASTVKATIHQKVSKPKVMAAILEKARTGGKALGRFVVGNSPYGRAFNLAMLALAGSKYFWSDEKGDFVREKDDDMYVIVATDKNSSSLGTYGEVDDKTLKQICERANVECTVIDYVKGANAARERAKSYCQSKSFTTYFGKTLNFDDYGWSGFCTKDNFYMSSTYAVKIFKYVDFVPITLDEFIDEATPEADSKPTDWVTTSEVEPDGEPTATVKGGTVAQTNPYTDPKDGKSKQTRWDFDDTDGDGDADTVRETTIDRPDLPPNSPEAPELQPPTDTDTGTDTGDKDKPKDDDDKDKDKEQQEQPDFCETNPDVLACQKMGEVENGFFDDIKIPNVVDDTTWEEDRFLPSNGVCPSPKSFDLFGKPIYLSYEPLCRFMQQVRFIILVAFILMSAYLVFGSLRKE